MVLKAGLKNYFEVTNIEGKNYYDYLIFRISFSILMIYKYSEPTSKLTIIYDILNYL